MICTKTTNRLSTDKALWKRPISFSYNEQTGLSEIMNLKVHPNLSALGNYSKGQRKKFLICTAKNIRSMHYVEELECGSIRESERCAIPLSQSSFAKRAKRQKEIDEYLEYLDFDFEFNTDI